MNGMTIEYLYRVDTTTANLGLLHMATGTGKTLVWSCMFLEGLCHLNVVVFPTLELVAQWIRDYIVRPQKKFGPEFAAAMKKFKL